MTLPRVHYRLQMLREFEGHLRTVTGERDAAIEQLEHVEQRRDEAERRLREAERQEVRPCCEGAVLNPFGQQLWL
jgi:hypothetical protein